MGRQERTDFYKDNRDYGNLLDEEGYEDEEYEEDERDGDGTRAVEEEEEEDLSQECQEYLRRRERFKELARQKLRREKENGRGSTISSKKPLPFDNYGSFFGPSEPVVARRVIEDARAREEASKLAKLVKNEAGMSKGQRGTSKGPQQPRASEPAKQSKPVNQTALRLQRLKEARDYSFLFTDEDPTTSTPAPATNTQHPTTSARRNGTHEPALRRQDNDNQRHTSKVVKSGGTTSQKDLPLTKMSSSSKLPRPNLSPAPHRSQERQMIPTTKQSRPSEKTPAIKPKNTSSVVSSSSNLAPKKNSLSSNLNSNKTISGPGRPLQSRPASSSTSLSSSKKPSSSSAIDAQVKSLVSGGLKGSATKQQMPSNKPVASKGVISHSSSSGSKSQVGTMRADQKRPGVVIPGRVGSGGQVDTRRPLQSGASSKQQMRPLQKPIRPPVKPVPKRSREIESEDDFFVDDDDDLEGGDVSSVIQKMFGYNPRKYRDLDDEDDRNMEANFRTIQMEEKRSARIAREEDERELQLIEEEERRERERARAKKKRKLQQR